MDWFIRIIMGALLLVGLLFVLVYVDSNAGVESSDFNVSCIDGVEYWYGQDGYKGYMAPRIDSGTLDFVQCDD